MELSSDTVGVRFEYDERHDVYIVYPCGTLRTEEDCKRWYEQFVTFFTSLGRRVDIVIVLDMLTVEPSCIALYNAWRLDILQRFVRYSARVNATSQVARVITAKSSSNPNHSLFADNIALAIRSILEMREGERPRA